MLCARVSKRHFGRSETLFSEGDQCRDLFVVAIGRIRIFKLSPSGREQVLAVEGPGELFAVNLIVTFARPPVVVASPLTMTTE